MSDFTHQMQNYLAIILGYANLLIEELPSDDHRRQDLEEIRRAAEAATTLLRAEADARS